MSARPVALPAWPETPTAPFPWAAWLNQRAQASLPAETLCELHRGLAAVWGVQDASVRLRGLGRLAERFGATAASGQVLLAALNRSPAESDFLLLWELPWTLQHDRRPPGGPELARLVSLLVELARLGLSAVDDSSSWPSTDAVLERLRAQPSLRDDVDVAVAGRLEGRGRTQELRRLLSQPPARAILEAQWTQAVATAAAAVQSCPHGLAALDALSTGGRFCLSALQFTALVAATRPPEPWRANHAPLAQLRAELARGVAWVESDPTHARSWEHQRWGLAGDPRPLVGRDYIQAILLDQLVQLQLPTALPRLRALLHRLPAAPLRYYGDWERLPPDCDSLGLFVGLAARIGGVPSEKVDAWLSVLRPSLRPDGSVPTWLEQGPHGPTTPEPRWTWGGNDCIASATMCILGLLHWDARGWSDVIVPNLERVLAAHAGGGDAGSFYYSRAWADLLLVDLHRLLQELGLHPTLTRRLGEQLARRVDERLATQGLDGGWGSPQDTALTLRLLVSRSPPPVAVIRALRYLSSWQRPDGSWQAEALFRTLGKPPFPNHPHEGPELTTLCCVGGLAAGVTFLEST